MFFMANIELINLVTTELVQRKKLAEYDLRIESNKPDGEPKKILSLIREYRELISDIRLWESLIDEITKTSEEEKNKGGDN